MKQKFYSIFLTALFGMFGMNAWAQTTYEIGTADDLVAFAEAVNGGETTANAVLTDDIDMSELTDWTAIGDWNTGAVTSAYCGHFDGQGHAIIGFDFTSNKNYFGIFGVVSTGCLIENLSVYGTMTSNVATSGVVGYARDATPTMRNIHSYLNINNTRAGARIGGILGSSVNGTVVVDRCTYSGTLDGNDAGGSGNYGGIVGYENNNANAHLRVTNCLFDGILKNTAATPGNCTFGGMVGYVGANPDVIIENCLSIGTVQSAITGQFYGAVKHNTCSIINSFYQGTNINGSASTVTPTTQEATLVTDEQLASGEIAYALNGSQTEDVNWFQALTSNNAQYVVTVNGEVMAPKTADVIFVDNTLGTRDFVLPEFTLYTHSMEIPVGDVRFEDVTINPDGTFSKTGTFSVDAANIPSPYTMLASFLKNIPYELNGRIDGDKIWAYIDDVAITLPTPYGTYDILIMVSPALYPTPYGTAVVYPAGRMHCDGTAYEGVEGFSNTPSEQDDHDFVDGFCTYCGLFDPEYMTANDDGFFEIGTANQLKWFALYVNQVDPAVNAILTADIDLNGVEWTPIGKNVFYTGTFDGQNFAIANFSYTGSGDYNGLFGRVKDAAIKNFSISGTLACAGSGSGVVGWSEGSTVSNIHSALTIEATEGTLHHAAGVVGGARYGGTNGGTIVDRCSFSGTMTVNAASNDCFGGIVGYTNDYCIIKNCINYGTITYYNPAGYVGGIIGYVNNTNCYGAHNCLNVGEIIYAGEDSPSYGGAIVGRLRGNDPDRWGYSYYLEGSAANASGENQITTNYEVTELQLSSGEVAAKLAPYIRQNIGTDTTPVLDPTHNVVAEITAVGYATLFVPNAEITIPTGVQAFTGEFESSWLKLNAVNNVIPAQTAVVLKGDAGIYEFVVSEPVPDGDLGIYDNEVDGGDALVKAWAAPIEGNVLKGTADDIDAAGRYVLAAVDAETEGQGYPVAFCLAESGKIRAGKAYLEIPEGTDIKGFYFSFGDDDTTGISTIDNGQLTKNKEIYNLAGQRLQKMQKGINIVGNKKVLY